MLNKNLGIKKLASNETWEPVNQAFLEWLGERHIFLKPGVSLKPTLKVLIFLALLEMDKACSYEEIRAVLKNKNVISGNIPNNTLRTSMLHLEKTLNKYQHDLKLYSSRGNFQLIERNNKKNIVSLSKEPLNPVIILLDPPAIKAEEIAYDLIEKAMLPFHSLYFLEWSARWWEIFSSSEAEIRVQYESDALEKLGIKDRLFKNANEQMAMVSLAPGEGLAEINILKKLLNDSSKKTIHYVAIDSSQRLLRDHISLLKETLTTEIESGRLICAGAITNIFSGLRESIARIRHEFKNRGIMQSEHEFMPPTCSMLVTYLGNCLGNNTQDQETEIFSLVRSVFENRPLEFLVGVSVMRDSPDEYKRNWDDFLLQTPKHLLETKRLLESSQLADNNEVAEFRLPEGENSDRCPPVIPESYIVRHQIEGQIYRFYYQLAFDLRLSAALGRELSSLPKGTMILLYNIIKYNMKTLVAGIAKCGLFKIKYDHKYHQIIDTTNGKREYAVFSAFLE